MDIMNTEEKDLDRLRCYVRRRLIASGWKTEVQKELRAGINEMEYQTLTVEEIYDKIAKSGIKVDERIKEEAFRKIKHCYKEALKNEVLDDGEKKVTDGMKNNVTRKNINIPHVKRNR